MAFHIQVLKSSKLFRRQFRDQVTDATRHSRSVVLRLKLRYVAEMCSCAEIVPTGHPSSLLMNDLVTLGMGVLMQEW